MSTVTWPPLPSDVGRHPQAVDVLVALPSATDVWGRAQWGVGHWGGWRFADPVPMECDVQGLTIERGRTDPLAHVQTGQLNVTLEDPDREWAPWVIPPDGFRSWRTGVPVQVRSSQGLLFTGSVAEITAAEEPKPDRARTVDFKALDPLTFLAASDQAEQYDQGGGELAGARLERIWAFARPPGWVDHRYDPGLATMQPTSLAKAALEESWLTADSDAGMMTCTPDGVVQYWDQNRGLADDRKVVPQYTFTDDDDLPEDVPVICTSSFSVSDDQGQVINWVAIAATGGTEEIAEDTASQSLYGIKTTHRNDLIHDEGQGWSKRIAEVFLSRVNRQAVVISPLVFDALRTPEAWAAAHFLDIADRVRVHRSADGAMLDVTASIDQIRHEITPTSWQVTIHLAPGTQRTYYARWGTARWGVDKWG